MNALGCWYNNILYACQINYTAVWAEVGCMFNNHICYPHSSNFQGPRCALSYFPTTRTCGSHNEANTHSNITHNISYSYSCTGSNLYECTLFHRVRFAVAVFEHKRATCAVPPLCVNTCRRPSG